jgi:hypothetical protein
MTEHRIRKRGLILAAGLLAIALATGCSGESSEPGRIQQATKEQLEAVRLDKLSLAPAARRVDLDTPTFSDPTRITNPLFPISKLRSAILAGKVGGKSFKTETTLLPDIRVIEWPRGRRTETLVSQYVAYLDGHIEEVALDYYAQADDGSVWYFGEDVFNYKDGFIADTGGTWIAGKEGPAAMIMPAAPKLGDVYRPENIPGLVFEEVAVKRVGKTVPGPRGPVEGAMIAQELHQDGAREDKTFAPNYGEFFTGSGGDVEAMALAFPTDRLSGPPAAELETLSAGADVLFHQPGRSGTLRRMTAAWETLERNGAPPRIAARMSVALDSLGRAVASGGRARIRQGAIGVAQSALDLQLRHGAPAAIDRSRFELWLRQLQVDAAAGDMAGVRGALATLEWIRDRFAHTLDKVDLARLDAGLVELRAQVDDENLRGAAAAAAELPKQSDRNSAP